MRTWYALERDTGVKDEVSVPAVAAVGNQEIPRFSMPDSPRQLRATKPRAKSETADGNSGLDGRARGATGTDKS